MSAVQNSRYALLFVEEQTPEICICAVQNDSLALQYVKKQTLEMSMYAL
jgi:hypothetical protein